MSTRIMRSIFLQRKISLHISLQAILPSLMPTMRLPGPLSDANGGRYAPSAAGKRWSGGLILRRTMPERGRPSGCPMKTAADRCSLWRKSSFPGFTMWRTTWPPSPPWTDWFPTRLSGTLPKTSAVWSTGLSWSGSWTACGTITIPSPPVPAGPSRD